MTITTTMVLPPVFGIGKCPKSKDSYKSINNKSTPNRKKHCILRMMYRREMWAAGIRFNREILSTPVPEYIKRIPNMGLLMHTVSVRRYNELKPNVPLLSKLDE